MARQARPDPASEGRADAPLRIQLLGGFRVAVAGRELADRDWKLRRAAAIVKLLALAPDRRLHREQVMDLLWPDLEPEVAAHNLNQALYIARRALEPALSRKQPSRYLPLQGQVLALCPADPLDLDVVAFEAAADRARDGADAAAYAAALARYTGELLPEDRYEDWASERREALHARRQGLLLTLAGVHERAGRHEEAISALDRLVGDEPTHETAHVALMRLHALDGRRSQALRQYHQLHDALARELAAAPDPASERLYQEILAGRFPPASGAGQRPIATPARAAPAHNLPVPLTSVVGRAGEIRALVAALTPPDQAGPSAGPAPRLVTLIGTGGCGKTRLALAVAAELVPRYPDGGWLVDLAVVAEPALVAKTVAQALAVKEEPNRPIPDTLAAALRDRRLLLVLDNCEHLIAACATLAQHLLARCPGISILATSRETLRVPGERPWRVPSLALPAATTPGDAATLVAAVRASEAGQLFAQRAAFLLPPFAIDAATAGAVAAICRRLDGIPLAIELAAARTALLSVEEIAARLDGALALLGGADRTAPSRQQTLRATLDWSYALLPAAEQRLLRQLAVFAGGWSLAAAETICGPAEATLRGGAGTARSPELPPPSPADTLSLLAALVEKSLVQVDLGGEGARYRLLEMVRQYAWSLLVADDEADETQRRHAAYFVELAEPTLTRWYTPQEGEQQRQLEREHDNLRAALAWGLTRPEEGVAARLAGSLWVYWFTRGAITEARRWLDAALAHPRTRDFPASYSQILNGLGYIANLQGDVPGAIAAYEERLAWQRARDERRGMISTLGNYAMLVREQLRDYRRSHDLCVEAIALARELGPANQLPILLNGLGLSVRYLGDSERARDLFGEALDLARRGGDPHNESSSLGNLAMIALDQGQLDEAQRLYREGLVIVRRLGKVVHLILFLTYLAEVAAVQGRPARAARLFGAAESLDATQEYRMSAIVSQRYERAVARVREQLSPDEFAAAWQAGTSLSLDDALDEALDPS